MKIPAPTDERSAKSAKTANIIAIVAIIVSLCGVLVDAGILVYFQKTVDTLKAPKLSVQVGVLSTAEGKFTLETTALGDEGSLTYRGFVQNDTDKELELAVCVTAPEALSFCSGTTIVSNPRYPLAENPETDTIVSPNGINIGTYKPGESAYIEFKFNIDKTKILTGINSIPLSFAVRSVDSGTWLAEWQEATCTVNIAND